MDKSMTNVPFEQRVCISILSWHLRCRYTRCVFMFSRIKKDEGQGKEGCCFVYYESLKRELKTNKVMEQGACVATDDVTASSAPATRHLVSQGTVLFCCKHPLLTTSFSLSKVSCFRFRRDCVFVLVYVFSFSDECHMEWEPRTKTLMVQERPSTSCASEVVKMQLHLYVDTPD